MVLFFNTVLSQLSHFLVFLCPLKEGILSPPGFILFPAALYVARRFVFATLLQNQHLEHHDPSFHFLVTPLPRYYIKIMRFELWFFLINLYPERNKYFEITLTMFVPNQIIRLIKNRFIKSPIFCQWQFEYGDHICVCSVGWTSN